MIEFITTIKTPILSATISIVIVSIVLTGLVTLSDIPFIISLAICVPLSVCVVVGIILLGELDKCVKNFMKG